jgi:hypothetical protein
MLGNYLVATHIVVSPVVLSSVEFVLHRLRRKRNKRNCK